MTRQVLRFDDQVGVRMLPGVQTRARQGPSPYLMRTNSAGFRSREFAPRPPDGVRRVLFFGDSFTEGVGVSDGQRFSDLLEELVPDTEVLNFGVRATGTDQQLLFFRENAPELHYDLVIVGLYTGDVLRNHSKYGVLTTADGASYEKPYFRTEGGELTLHNVPVPKAASDYGDLDRGERQLVYNRGLKYRARTLVRDYAPWAKTVLQRITRYQPAPYLRSADDPAWVLTRAIVDQWAKEADAPLMVLAIPPYQYVEGTANAAPYTDRFGELGAMPDVRVHDPLGDLQGVAKAQGAASIRIPGDAHYNAAGHRVIAESMAPAVAEMLETVPTQASGGQR